jgi:hypothetical protein
MKKDITPLAALLQACTDDQRKTLADLAGTEVNYLYSLAGCHRERISAKLALGIEDASTALHKSVGTPIVTARQLSLMCALRGFD